ncbi:MAG: DUF1684 domain-containing protein [Terriglobales bacterium]
MKRTWSFIFALAIAMQFAALALADKNPSPPAPDAAYIQSFDKWKAELVDDLKANWLSLAGLFWLKPGENSFGSDAGNAIVFPKGPAHAGVFELRATDVTVKFGPDARATIDGKPVTTAKLQPDTSGSPTIVELGSLRIKVIVRGQRIGIRLKDLDSEQAKNYHGPIFFPLDLSYRVTATWVPSDGKRTVDVPNVLGDTTPTPVAGTVVFKINGQEVRLTDLGGNPSKGLSFVFNDLTSRTDTYPGGRFLETEPVVNGTVVIDFNRAYNPPCAVTPYATCPLAPKENRLAVAIPAGEKYDRTHGHH